MQEAVVIRWCELCRLHAEPLFDEARGHYAPCYLLQRLQDPYVP